MAFGKLLQRRHFRPARLAPGSPEIEQHGPASQIGGLPGFAIQIGQHERRQRTRPFADRISKRRRALHTGFFKSCGTGYRNNGLEEMTAG